MVKRILVCGAGSIGQRHIKNLVGLGAEVFVWRVRKEYMHQIAQDFNVKCFDHLSDAISAVDGVVVATATDKHIEVSAEVLKAKKALYLEKPISNNWHGVCELQHLAKDSVIEVGCQFRSHPSLVALSSELCAIGSSNILTYRLAMGYRLDAWRINQDYRMSYSVDAKRGGGALFDLIHQIDISLWLFGNIKDVSAVLSKRSELCIDGDDVTNLMITHESGVTGHIQVDMASPVYRCEAEILTKDAIYAWSDIGGEVRKQTSEDNLVIEKVPVGFERNDLFLSNMRHWLKRIDDSKIQPLCSFEEGMHALKVAIASQDAYIFKKVISL